LPTATNDANSQHEHWRTARCWLPPTDEDRVRSFGVTHLHDQSEPAQSADFGFSASKYLPSSRSFQVSDVGGKKRRERERLSSQSALAAPAHAGGNGQDFNIHKNHSRSRLPDLPRGRQTFHAPVRHNHQPAGAPGFSFSWRPSSSRAAGFLAGVAGWTEVAS